MIKSAAWDAILGVGQCLLEAGGWSTTGVAKAAGRSGLSWIEVPRVAWNLYRYRVLRGWLQGRIGDC
jgi:hypothetical protein